MSQQEKMMRAPLRAGLLPVALVGWGILRDWWWLGAILAVLVELPRLIKGRKDFQAPDFSRAFTLTWLLVNVVALILWLQDANRDEFEILVECLPLFFLPVILCQLFARESDYPLHVTTILSDWRFKTEQKNGGLPKEWRMHFGYPYLFLTLVGASWNLSSLEKKGMFAVLVILVLWRLIFYTQASRPSKRWRGQLVYTLTCCVAIACGYGAIKLYQWIDSGRWINYILSDSPIETSTQLGKLGEIKQDTNIHWRIIQPETAPPPLLKDRIFNNYINKSWYHTPVSGRIRSQDFEDFNRTPMGAKMIHLPDPQMSSAEAVAQTISSYRIRGKGRQRTLLPNTNSLIYMENDSVEGIEYNSIGTIVATNPVTGVVDYTIHSKSVHERDPLEMPPSVEEDLQIPTALKDVLQEFAQEHGISNSASAMDASRGIRKIFRNDFTYSLHGKISGSNPIKKFLQEVKSGHCEYFATAGCLLLRQLGYPARYTVGYAVKEYDELDQEWCLRGTHAHAWVRVWDEETERWIDVEFTPASEMQFSHAKPSVVQNIQDSIKKWREDFIVWRSENGESWVFTILPWFLLMVLIGVFGRNLMKARSLSQQESQIDRLMRPLAKILKVAPRSPTQTHRQWLSTLPLKSQMKIELNDRIEHLIYGETGDVEALKLSLKRARKELREL